MKSIRILVLILFACLVSTSWSQAQAGQKHEFITFDAPNTGTGFDQGTFVEGINQAGIVGWSVDASYASHAFLRTPDGSITTFDVPGAKNTLAFGMNPKGEIVGRYDDMNDVFHGFLRARDGTFTTIDAPGTGTTPGHGTLSGAINPAGEISGGNFDTSDVDHAYLLARDGSFTIVEPPGTGTGPFQGVGVALFYGLNPAGVLTNSYIDANDVNHGFMRARASGRHCRGIDKWLPDRRPALAVSCDGLTEYLLCHYETRFPNVNCG